MITDETIRRVLKFRDDRDWRQFHTPKDLAISLNLECAELLELFQWSGADLECRDKLPAMREELADVAACCILLADACGLELDEIIAPALWLVGRLWARGRAEKYTQL